jgi:hypothetical protein
VVARTLCHHGGHDERSAAPRKQRETRAYRLTLATGGFTVVAVVTLVLALVTSMTLGVPFIAIVLAAISGWMHKNTLTP